ncbi:MAG: hypothetical protein HRU09_04850 [Oligoflexales bacterium]|nr:hypothetical protein [Oligoflexales bacterium]
MKRLKAPIFALLMLSPDACLALATDVGGIGALMMQPNSQYYHYSAGAFAGVSTEKQGFLWRVSFIERPKYETSTHADGEAGLFTHFGTKVTSGKRFYLLSFLGVGRMFGYLQDLNTKERRSYNVEGLSFQAEAVMQLGRFFLSLSHQTFIAKDGDDQFEAYVVWPFNFLSMRIGVSI